MIAEGGYNPSGDSGVKIYSTNRAPSPAYFIKPATFELVGEDSIVSAPRGGVRTYVGVLRRDVRSRKGAVKYLEFIYRAGKDRVI